MIPKKLIEELNRWIDGQLYGNLQINFTKGKVLNVNRNESIKVESTYESVVQKIEVKAITNL